LVTYAQFLFMESDDEDVLSTIDAVLGDENGDVSDFGYQSDDYRTPLDNVRSRAFVFTIHNYCDTAVRNLRDLSSGAAKDRHSRPVQARYIVWNYELCPSSNRPHIQGYVYFQAVRSVACLKYTLARGTTCSPRIAIAKGNAQQNRAYCTKKDTADPSRGDQHFEEYGEIPAQGKRTELESWVESVVGGKRPRDAVRDRDFKFLAQFVKYGNGYSRLLAATIPKRNQPPTVYWLYGPTGSGKSRKAREWYPNAYVYPKLSKGTPWWDGYEGETDIIIDDMREDTFSFDYLLNLLDRYEFNGAVKGSFTPVNASNIVITAPKDWQSMFAMVVRENVNQLGRRITKTYKVMDGELEEQTYDLNEIEECARANIRN
jgi:hypothetical protein